MSRDEKDPTTRGDIPEEEIWDDLDDGALAFEKLLILQGHLAFRGDLAERMQRLPGMSDPNSVYTGPIGVVDKTGEVTSDSLTSLFQEAKKQTDDPTKLASILFVEKLSLAARSEGYDTLDIVSELLGRILEPEQ